MEPMAIGLVSLISNSETHMTAICDARLLYGRGGFHGYSYAVQPPSFQVLVKGETSHSHIIVLKVSKYS